MESTTTESTTANQTGMPWADVAAASAEAQKPISASSRRIVDVLRIPVTPEIEAKIARDNAADDELLTGKQSEIDDIKDELKAKKGEADAITKRMRERHGAVRSRVLEIKGEWILTDIFATNTVQYTDPETGLVVHERPMTSAERQQELPLAPTSSPVPSDDEGEDADDAPFSEDDDTTINDPQDLLDQATDVEEDDE